MSFVRDYNTLPPLPGTTTNNTPLPAIPVQTQQNYRPYDVAPSGAGNYSTLESALLPATTVGRRPPMPLPVTFNVSPYENVGGRRLRRTKRTRRHCKTKQRRRQNKKKSKKRT